MCVIQVRNAGFWFKPNIIPRREIGILLKNMHCRMQEAQWTVQTNIQVCWSHLSRGRQQPWGSWMGKWVAFRYKEVWWEKEVFGTYKLQVGWWTCVCFETTFALTGSATPLGSVCGMSNIFFSSRGMHCMHARDSWKNLRLFIAAACVENCNKKLKLLCLGVEQNNSSSNVEARAGIKTEVIEVWLVCIFSDQ